MIEEYTKYMIIGIIAGAFATFAPVMFGHAIDAIMSIIKNA